MTENPLYIPVGIPGCGKSSFARMLLPGIRIISTDSIREDMFGGLRIANKSEDRQANNDRVFALFHDTLATALDYGYGAYADATSLTPESREYLRNIAERRNAPTHLIVFKNTQQAIARNGERPLDKAVPWEVQKQMLTNYYDMLNTLQEGERDLYTTVTEITWFG